MLLRVWPAAKDEFESIKIRLSTDFFAFHMRNENVCSHDLTVNLGDRAFAHGFPIPQRLGIFAFNAYLPWSGAICTAVGAKHLVPNNQVLAKVAKGVFGVDGMVPSVEVCRAENPIPTMKADVGVDMLKQADGGAHDDHAVDDELGGTDKHQHKNACHLVPHHINGVGSIAICY